MVIIDFRLNKPLFEHINLLNSDPNQKFRKVLILSNRINHLKLIDELLQKKDKRWQDLIGYYIGGMKDEDLKKSESKKIILATFSMAAEALDIKSLTSLFLASPKTDIIQAVGRILREKHRNPLIIDLIDNHEVFLNQFTKRRAWKLQKMLGALFSLYRSLYSLIEKLKTRLSMLICSILLSLSSHQLPI